MKAGVSCLALFSAMVLASSAAAAEPAGAWRVTGAVSDRPFTMDCRFETHGTQLGGVCVELEAKGPGKSHTLAQGAVAGSQVSWSYPASFMMAKFDVSFAGKLDGDRIAGTVTASGRKGAFTATRK